MDGVTSFSTAKRNDSGHRAITCDSCCAFGRKVAPLIAGCVIGLLLAPVYPLVAGAFVVAGALWTGYLIIKPLFSYDIGHFHCGATIDELFNFPNDVAPYVVSKLVGNKEELLEGPFNKEEEELSSVESEDGYNDNKTSHIFIDLENRVIISVYQDQFYCSSAKAYYDNADCITWVSSIYDNDADHEKVPGWARRVGLNQGDPVLFIDDICVIDMPRDDVLKLLTKKADVSVCFLKSDDLGQPYFMKCQSHGAEQGKYSNPGFSIRTGSVGANGGSLVFKGSSIGLGCEILRTSTTELNTGQSSNDSDLEAESFSKASGSGFLEGESEETGILKRTETESYQENEFFEVNKIDDLHRGNPGYRRFIDHQSQVDIQVCNLPGMVKAAQNRINKGEAVALVSKVISASNLKDGESVGWGEHVGLSEGDVLLYVGDQCTIGLGQDHLDRLCKKTEAMFSFLKQENVEKAYLMNCEPLNNSETQMGCGLVIVSGFVSQKNKSDSIVQ